MKREPVSSSSVSSIGYDSPNKILEIELRGSVYQYFDVPRRIYQDLMNAASIGRYYVKFVRNAFRYRKVN